MDDEPKQTYSAREIVLELFPATHERLVPRPRCYRLERGRDGTVEVRASSGEVRLQLTPLGATGNHTTQLCCDLCQQTSTRRYLQFFRAEVPGSDGRRFRYVTACRDTDGCEARRLGDEPLEALLRPAS